MHPHYVRDYRRMARVLARRYDRDTAMALAVGGSYEEIGAAELAFLRSIGFNECGYLIDVGCGSGRLAYQLRASPIRYLGTDVVPSLLDYAKERCGRPDWVFTPVDGLIIPERDGVADTVTAFSVLTHLSESEGFAYLSDAARVAKPGGLIVVSFLDSTVEHHTKLAGGWLSQTLGRLRGLTVKNFTVSQEQLGEWGDHLGLTATFHGPEFFGQSCCVFRPKA
jgi:ubiquinone/menaquinone biosynthesis C-methylase UbiE